MLFSFKQGDAKDSVIRRRAQRPRRAVGVDKLSQIQSGSASEDLIADNTTDLYMPLLCSRMGRGWGNLLLMGDGDSITHIHVHLFLCLCLHSQKGAEGHFL